MTKEDLKALEQLPAGELVAYFSNAVETLRAKLTVCAAYLDALSENHLRNDVDMLLDPCRDPAEVAEDIRKTLGDWP